MTCELRDLRCLPRATLTNRRISIARVRPLHKRTMPLTKMDEALPLFDVHQRLRFYVARTPFTQCYLEVVSLCTPQFADDLTETVEWPVPSSGSQQIRQIFRAIEQSLVACARYKNTGIPCSGEWRGVHVGSGVSASSRMCPRGVQSEQRRR